MKAYLLAPLLLWPLAGCFDSNPPLPDRRVLSGSDWIPGSSHTSFQSQGEPIEIYNAGPGTLVLGEGPDAIRLAPGTSHLTQGQDLSVRNEGDEETRVHVSHGGENLPSHRGVPVEMRRGNQVQTIYTKHKSMVQVPAVAGSKPIQK